MITADELDPSIHAAAANRYAATVYLGFEPRTDEHVARGLLRHRRASSRPAVARSPSASSARSRPCSVLAPGRASGMRLAVLRETRMTAVVCSLGPVQRVVDAAPAISDAVVAALAAWAAAPMPPPGRSDLTELSP